MKKSDFIKLTKPRVEQSVEHLKNIEKSVQENPDLPPMLKKLDVLPRGKHIEENVIYVNGVGNDYTAAEKNRDHVQKYFSGHSVKLIHNATKKIIDDRIGIVGDLPECVADYTWGIGATTGKITRPILTPASISSIAVFTVAKERNLPLGIVGSSQGTLITFNAILALTILETNSIEYLRECVRVCHTGVVIPQQIRIRIDSLVNKYVDCVNKKDPVANIIGLTPNLNNSLIPLVLANLKFHYVPYYLPVSNHVFDYYRRETDLDEHEPYVKKDFFVNPPLQKNPNDTNQSSKKWLEPILSTMMSG